MCIASTRHAAGATGVEILRLLGGGDADDRDTVAAVGLGGADGAGERQSVHAGHLTIGQDERIAAVLPFEQGAGPVGGDIDRETQGFELDAQQGLIGCIVVDDQEAASLGLGFVRDRRECPARAAVRGDRGDTEPVRQCVHQLGDPIERLADGSGRRIRRGRLDAGAERIECAAQML